MSERKGARKASAEMVVSYDSGSILLSLRSSPPFAPRPPSPQVDNMSKITAGLLKGGMWSIVRKWVHPP